MIEWQQYPGKRSENIEYAIVNNRKVEITKAEHGVVFVMAYKKMLPANPKGRSWWRPTEGPLRLVNLRAAKEYAEQWLTGDQEG